MRVLGVDAALRSTGYAVVEQQGGRTICLHRATFRQPAARPLSACLHLLQRELTALLDRHRPAAAALEGGFYFKNARTALLLGEVRGVVIAACAAAGVAVFEYSPRRVKQSLTGVGSAGKAQVARMVAAILGLPSPPPEDEADALAIALCHLHSRTGISALQPRPL